MDNVNVEENKLKRKSIIDNWLKIKNPLVEYQDQRVENFEMLMAFCTLTKRQRSLLSKQSVEQILSMLDVVYNGISRDCRKLYHWKAKNGVVFSSTKIMEAEVTHSDDFLAISTNAKTLVIRETYRYVDSNNEDVFNVFGISGKKMTAIKIIRCVKFDGWQVENYKLSPDGLFLLIANGSYIGVYDLYNDIELVLTGHYINPGTLPYYDICESIDGALVAVTDKYSRFRIYSLTFDKNKNTEKLIGHYSIDELNVTGKGKREYIKALAFVQDGKHIIAASSGLDCVYMFNYVSSTMIMKMQNYETSHLTNLKTTEYVVRNITIDKKNNMAIVRFSHIDRGQSDPTAVFVLTHDAYYAIDISSGKIVMSPKDFERLSYESDNRCVNNNDVSIFAEQHVEYHETNNSYRKDYYSFLRVRETYSQKYIDVIAGYPESLSRPINVYESFD
jgi:WD40 repeat protein